MTLSNRVSLFSFTKLRFLQLDVNSQHKKCYELLKWYWMFLKKHPESSYFLAIEYAKWCEWMQINFLPAWEFFYIEERFHWHVMHSGRIIKEHDFLNSSLAISVCNEDKTTTDYPWLFVTTYLDGLRSAHNVGSIIRTVEALRLGPVVFSHSMADISHPQIHKTAMGASSHVSLFKESKSIFSTDGEVVPHPYPLPRPWIAVETALGAVSWKKASYPAACTLFLGNEERGLLHNVISQCDFVIQVPLYGLKNSINVANCHAVIAAEIASQVRERERE